MREAISFAVTVALERARRAKEARHDFVRHLSEGEIQAYYRCCKAELGLERKRAVFDEEADANELQSSER